MGALSCLWMTPKYEWDISFHRNAGLAMQLRLLVAFLFRAEFWLSSISDCKIPSRLSSLTLVWSSFLICENEKQLPGCYWLNEFNYFIQLIVVKHSGCQTHSLWPGDKAVKNNKMKEDLLWWQMSWGGTSACHSRRSQEAIEAGTVNEAESSQVPLFKSEFHRKPQGVLSRVNVLMDHPLLCWT